MMSKVRSAAVVLLLPILAACSSDPGQHDLSSGSSTQTPTVSPTKTPAATATSASPTGTTLLEDGPVVPGRYRHIVDAVSGHDQVIGTVLIEGSEWSWSPDGSRLVFADTDGTEQLLDRVSGTTVPIRPRLSGHVLPIWKLVWSPDGRRLVGTAADPDASTGGFGLVSMDPDGGSVKVLTPWTLALYSEADASWSPR